jgi:hypothetical protein
VERLLARLERKYGRYAPGNLTYGLIGAQLAGLVLGLVAHDARQFLYFDLQQILQGQVWRVISWVAIPPWVEAGPGGPMALFWALFTFYWLYWMGTSLEAEWGAFKFLVFWLLGVIGTIVAAAISGAQTDNALFLLTFFLAFATLWPDYQIRLFFFVPIKVKWLAYFDGGYLLILSLTRPGFEKLLPAVMVANYLLFFHQTLIDRVRGIYRQAERAGARNRMRAARDAVVLPLVRRCAICGASNQDPEVEIRVCDCEKCGGVRRDLCLPHAKNH